MQSEIIWEDQTANHQLAEAQLTRISPEPGSLVVLPELFDIGFSMNVAALNEAAVGELSESWCAEISRRFQIYLQAASLRNAGGGKFRATNNAVVFNPEGRLICCYQKIFPFGEEAEHYQSGSRIVTFDWQGIRVCPLICYDLRFAELWRLATLDFGVELFTCGANWPDIRQRHWTTLLEARAIENLAYVVGVNRCGTDPQLRYAGGSRIISPQGKILAEAGSAANVISAEIKGDAVRAWRAQFRALGDVRREFLGKITGPESAD